MKNGWQPQAWTLAKRIRLFSIDSSYSCQTAIWRVICFVAEYGKLARLVVKAMTTKLNWANRITIFRILLIVPFVSFMLKTNDAALSQTAQHMMRHISMALFLLMAVSDGLDGYLARTKNQITKLGAFLDPIADKLLITSACLLLASQAGHVGQFLLPPTAESRFWSFIEQMS